MRLWHVDMLGDLSNQRILGQHRECCALRGNGWGRKHSTVDYVFKYDPIYLYVYHCEVMDEMKRRGYNYDNAWEEPEYRGKNCMPWPQHSPFYSHYRYAEHDADYMVECLENIARKESMIK
ncbi:MAG TPA: TIGR02328 family protein [Saccharofermentans sp.]|nr:TIGR02328 family protein [Saccharofermentans sp.]